MNILEEAAWAATDKIYPAWARRGQLLAGHPRRRTNGLAGTGGYPEFRYAYPVPFRGSTFPADRPEQASVTQYQRSGRNAGATARTKSTIVPG